MFKDIAKSAAIGLAVGSGIVGGIYVGGKIVGVGYAVGDKLKKTFSKDKPTAEAQPAK